MKIYVAGPMTGIPDNNYPAFRAAAARLRADGHDVSNPAELELPEGSPWSAYMRACLPLLSECEAIYLLPGFEASRGARLERHIALELGMTMLYAPQKEAA
jgi:hypothetical protein